MHILHLYISLPFHDDHDNPDSKVNWANMGPTWVLPAPDGPHVGTIKTLLSRNKYIIMKIIKREMGKQITHGPIASIEGDWDNKPNRKHTLDIIYQTSVIYTTHSDNSAINDMV